MNDPYQKIFEDIAKALTKYSEMIVWIAERTLSVKDYLEFLKEFSTKPDKFERFNETCEQGDTAK